jgi:hypothetical protein
MNIQGRIGPQYSAIQEITVHTDTRDILSHARRAALRRGLQDWFVCDIDAHHVETVSWKEIVTYIEDPVVRDNAISRWADASRIRTDSAKLSRKPVFTATSS